LEDGIDLRKWVDILIRQWWLIAAITLTTIAISIIISYGIQTPLYESSGGATLPTGLSDSGIGLTVPGYQEFASSTAVLDRVGEKAGLDSSAGELRNQYEFSVDENRFITVTATAGSAEQAFLLASGWIEAYDHEIRSKLQSQFNQLKAESSQNTNLIFSQLDEARKNLARFDLENPLEYQELELAALASDLSSREQRLRELTTTAIPGAEARLASLRDLLDEEGGTAGGGGRPASAISLPSPPEVLAPFGTASTNPAFFELRQSLMKSQLLSLEGDLVRSENRLRELTLTSLSTTETNLASLRKALAAEPKFLTGPPEGTSAGMPGTAPIPNPTYIQLSQDLAQAQVRLETGRKEAEVLADKIITLQGQIKDLRLELVTNQVRTEELRLRAANLQEIENIERGLAAKFKETETLRANIPALEQEIIRRRADLLTFKAQRQELEREVARFSAEYEAARSELDGLIAIESDLATVTGLSTIREPAVPTDPISPQKARNISLAAILGIMSGVAVVVLVDFYRNRPMTTTSDRE
jgi:capsular polysaccharide biosynthesis protein